MENDDSNEYEGIFNDDEVVDMILFGEVEKGVQKKNSGCFTTLLAISGLALFGLLIFILI